MAGTGKDPEREKESEGGRCRVTGGRKGKSVQRGTESSRKCSFQIKCVFFFVSVGLADLIIRSVNIAMNLPLASESILYIVNESPPSSLLHLLFHWKVTNWAANLCKIPQQWVATHPGSEMWRRIKPWGWFPGLQKVEVISQNKHEFHDLTTKCDGMPICETTDVGKKHNLQPSNRQIWRLLCVLMFKFRLRTYFNDPSFSGSWSFPLLVSNVFAILFQFPALAWFCHHSKKKNVSDLLLSGWTLLQFQNKCLHTCSWIKVVISSPGMWQKQTTTI